MMSEEEWVSAAMGDDALVAELLVRLNRFDAAAKAAPLEWGVRQPRSRHVQHRCSTATPAVSSTKKGGESARASPTTPLSWSGGASVSGAAAAGDLYEECSRPAKPTPPQLTPAGFRSKGVGGSESSIRRSRKKKTFAELKEEECLLLKESVYLKREVARLQAVWEEKKVQNRNLKKMKLELPIQSVKQMSTSDVSKETTTCYPFSRSNLEQIVTVSPANVVECGRPDDAACATPHLSYAYTMPIVAVTQKNPEVPNDAATQKCCAALPDLNLPFEEDYVPEDIYGMS